MVTNDVEALKQEAVSRIIFQGTPRAWLAEQGPWLLERGEVHTSTTLTVASF
jgi:hypothetical protein